MLWFEHFLTLPPPGEIGRRLYKEDFRGKKFHTDCLLVPDFLPNAPSAAFFFLVLYLIFFLLLLWLGFGILSAALRSEYVSDICTLVRI